MKKEQPTNLASGTCNILVQLSKAELKGTKVLPLQNTPFRILILGWLLENTQREPLILSPLTCLREVSFQEGSKHHLNILILT